MNPTVLIIENDQATRTAVAEVLSDEGYGTVAIEDAEQATEYLESHDAPCLVLLDLGLPRVSGTEFLRWLRGEDAFRGLAVAIMSAWRPAEKGIDEYRDRIVGVLRKPFSVAALLTLVERHCGPGRHVRPRDVTLPP
jgi:two-component system alkaline phosphatase synthesis response regulator PhoP